MLKALLSWLDDEQARAEGAEDAPTVADAAPSSGSRVDAFNEHVARIHMLIVHKAAEAAAESWLDLREGCLSGFYAAERTNAANVASAAAPAASRSTECSACGRSVTNLSLHRRVCPATASTAHSPAKAPSVPSNGVASDPQDEIVEFMRQKVVACLQAALAAKPSSEGDDDAAIDDILHLWAVACSVDDSTCSDTAAAALIRCFAATAHDIRQQMDAARALLTMEALHSAPQVDSPRRPRTSATAASSSADATAAAEWTKHPFFACHRRAVACTVMAAGDAAASGDAGPPPLTMLARVLFGVDSAVRMHEDAAVSKESQPHTHALASMLGAATQIMLRVMACGAPYSDRVRVVTLLHSHVCEAVLPCITAYARDTMMSTTLAVAGAVRDETMRAGRVHIDLSATAPGGRMLLVREAKDVSVDASATASVPAMLPIALPHDLAVSVVDEAADHVCFMCQVCERYLRGVCACIGVGPADAPSRLTDKLSECMHALQSEYVLLEQAYMLVSARHCVAAASGWAHDCVSDDAHAHAFAWCDNIFFLFSKAIERSASTASDMATAAIINVVCGCMEDVVSFATAECVTRASTRTAAFPSDGVTRPMQPRTARAVMEDEIAAQLSAALLGGATRPPEGPTAALKASAARDQPTAGAVLEAPIAVSEDAMVAVNTLFLAHRNVDSLHSRTRDMLTASFPAPRETGVAQRDASDDVARGCLRSLASCIHQLQDMPRTVHDAYRRGCTAFCSAVTDAPVRSVVSVVRSQRYVLDAAEYDAVMEDDVVQRACSRALTHEFALFSTCQRLTKPEAADDFVAAAAHALLDACRGVWRDMPVNEFGALRLHEEAMHMHTVAASYSSTHSLRAVYAHAFQEIQVLGVETLAELYTLTFPQPMLTRAEVAALLRRNVRFSTHVQAAARTAQRMGGGTVSGDWMAAVDWSRVKTSEMGA